MRAALYPALAVALSAPTVFGQTVQFRVVERTGQSQANPADNVLDLAVQARFTGRNLGGFYFDVKIPGESESRGTFARANISNVDGTYDPSFGIGNTVGRSGLSRQFSYFATVNPNFNGLINQSAGTFTNTPDQEIGLITAYVQGNPLLGTPGIDTDGDGNPDTWSGNGLGLPPIAGTTAALNGAAAGPYFGSAQFIDVYRFRYTVSDLTPRNLHFQLNAIVGQQFTQLVYSGGIWGAQNTTTASTAISSTPLDISVVPAPAGAGLLGLAGLLAARRRRAF